MNEKSAGGIDFDHLAELFVARLRQGERPSVSDYVERHPELADEILELFSALAEMEGLKSDPAGATGSFLGRRSSGDGAVIPEQLGDYRILRLIGQGGMGVVYEARRESLSAPVALKVLHQNFRGKAAFLRRFRNEARSAARLHHTNIVPVFDFGEHDGILYYVMQYIPGQSLDRVLADVRRPAADDLVHALARWPDSRDEFDLRAVIDRLIVTNDAAFARAVALHPGDPQIWVARGRHLAWLGRWKDASNAFAKGITSRPPQADWIEYAAVLVLAGDEAGYRRLCDRIVEHLKKPGADRHWYTLSDASRITGFSAASGVAPELMLQWADAARAIDPNQNWLYYLVGAARLRAKNQDAAALQMLILASKETPGWPGAGMTWYALAIIHRRLGHNADARRWLERADSWMADREREAATASTVLPKTCLRDYLEAKVLEREAKLK